MDYQDLAAHIEDGIRHAAESRQENWAIARLGERYAVGVPAHHGGGMYPAPAPEGQWEILTELMPGTAEALVEAYDLGGITAAAELLHVWEIDCELA
jgi:hypothetical protein